MAVDVDEAGAGVSCVPTFAAWALPTSRSTVSRARALVGEGLAGRGFAGEALAEGELMACELVTNAVRHAYPPFELRLHVTGKGIVVCEVVDGLQTLPPIPAGSSPNVTPELSLNDIDTLDIDQLEGGRGLDVVARLSGNRLGACPTRTCTTTPAADAKAVWFALATTAAGV